MSAGPSWASGLVYVWQRRWLKVAGTCGLLGAAVIFHGIYNLLIAYGGRVQYVAYALPVLAVALGKIVGKFLLPLPEPDGKLNRKCVLSRRLAAFFAPEKILKNLILGCVVFRFFVPI